MMSSFLSPNSAVIYDRDRQQWWSFQNPQHVCVATQLESVLPTLHRVEQWVATEQLYAVGFVSYEAAPAFDPALMVRSASAFPLVWFGLYAAPEPIVLPLEKGKEIQDVGWHATISSAAYHAAIRRVKASIKAGDTYQVNYSFRLNALLKDDPWTFFLRMIQAQGSGYGAYLNLQEWAICSASPELFFQQEGDTLISRPMKGTVARGLSWEGDRHQAQWLRRSEKNQAENVMIVDMVRNDMAHVAELGSVQVTHLFDLEQYPTLWQLTSTVQCRTQASLVEIFQAMFPPASITGAPKARTMQIIADLETSPRNIYTGSIGFLTPTGRAQFNVAIRTVLVETATHAAEYGVGGGIIWDSQDEAELEECYTKAKILTQVQPDFSLLETLLWTPQEGYFLLDYHLTRLKQSAEYFAIALDLQALNQQLSTLAQQRPKSAHKVRLLVSRQGEISLSSQPISDVVPSIKACVAPDPVDSTNPFLYHKTTARSPYQQALAACPDADDVLLWNERGEITEFCLGNVVVEREGQWLTPPQQCGLLAGTYRAWLLEQGKVTEQVIRVEDLHQYSAIYRINAVRKMQKVVLAVQATV